MNGFSTFFLVCSLHLSDPGPDLMNCCCTHFPLAMRFNSAAHNPTSICRLQIAWSLPAIGMFGETRDFGTVNVFGSSKGRMQQWYLLSAFGPVDVDTVVTVK